MHTNNFMLESIQAGLVSLWPLINFYCSQPELEDYSAPILQSARTVEQMTTVLVTERGYECPSGAVALTKEQAAKGAGRLSPFQFVRKGYLEDVPREVCNFIDIISMHRNMAAHARGVSYAEAVVFAGAFDGFLGWFILNSTSILEMDEPDRTRFLSQIKSLSSEITVQIRLSDNVVENCVVSSVIPQARQAAEKGGDAVANAGIIAFIGKMYDMLERIQSDQGEIKSSVVRVERKVDEIADKLDQLSRQINNYQSLVTRQINMAASEEEVERIISAYSDECTARITREINRSNATKAFTDEENKLRALLGESAWGKMQPESRSFLTTARITYNNLLPMQDIVDYSGVCLLATKTLEVELKRRFYHDYWPYLALKYPGGDCSKYPTALLGRNNQLIRAEDFSLGTVAFLFCYRENKYAKASQKKNDKQEILEYCSKKIFRGKKYKEIEALLNKYSESIEEARKEYRNPSAHTNELRRVQAEECFDLILDVQKLLKTMLDSMDY